MIRLLFVMLSLVALGCRGAASESVLLDASSSAYLELSHGELDAALTTLPDGLKVQRIRRGAQAAKLAIIGRSMKGVVTTAAQHLTAKGIAAETFAWSTEADRDWAKRLEDYRVARHDVQARLPFADMQESLGYAENQAWAQKLVRDDYTVLDMGDPTAKSAKDGPSAFYEMEKTVIFGDH